MVNSIVKTKQIMNTNNIKQFLQNITKHLSIAGLGLSIFNTINNQTTIKSLRENLDIEKDINTKLITEINTLITKNNNKADSILNKNIEINNNKLDKLNIQLNEIINKNLYDDTTLSNVNDSIKDINSELVQIINKIDETINSDFIGTDIFNVLQSYINSLNYFQSFALSHLFGFIFIFLSIVSLYTVYFGDFLIEKYFNKDKYPRIYKLIQLRRTFQRFYLIKDLIIILLILLILSILNIMMFANFTL